MIKELKVNRESRNTLGQMYKQHASLGKLYFFYKFGSPMLLFCCCLGDEKCVLVELVCRCDIEVLSV
jgi:hypothetical protein